MISWPYVMPRDASTWCIRRSCQMMLLQRSSVFMGYCYSIWRFLMQTSLDSSRKPARKSGLTLMQTCLCQWHSRGQQQKILSHRGCRQGFLWIILTMMCIRSPSITKQTSMPMDMMCTKTHLGMPYDGQLSSFHSASITATLVMEGPLPLAFKTDEWERHGGDCRNSQQNDRDDNGTTICHQCNQLGNIAQECTAELKPNFWWQR